MPSSFDTALDTWSDKTDGVHDVLAAHVNDLAAFVLAVQAVIGRSDATAGAASIRGWLKALGYYGMLQRGTSTASAATLTLPADGLIIPITGTTGITDITAPTRVQLAILEFAGILTVTDGNNIELTGGTNFTTAAGDYLTLHWTGSAWREVFRSRAASLLSYATTADIADTAATESAGSATTVPRGDHVHALGAHTHGSAAGQGGALTVDTLTGGTRVAADVAFAATTALGTVTGLSVTVTAGTTYEIEARLFVTADATGGQKYAVAGTATATAIIYDTVIGDLVTPGNTVGARATALGTVLALAGNTNTAFAVTVRGTITVNAGGTLLVQAAQNSASGTTTVLRGSTLRVRAVA
jgi:hypothetical protein